jgi:5-methylcytosine-specific restriction protein A
LPLLYYWQPDNYRRDLDFGVGYHLNQSNAIMHSIDVGDSLWAFTRSRIGKYCFAARLIVRAKTTNPPNFRYGRYRVWGDLKLSSFYRIEGQPNAELLIRAFSLKTDAKILAQSFQGKAAVRKISHSEGAMIEAFTQHFVDEPRARILPEERLEAMLLLGNTEGVKELIRLEGNGISKKRQEYLYQLAPKRNQKHAAELQKMYDGKCQVCLWDAPRLYAERLCHAHHINWLCRGGEDSLRNLVLVCPNHHMAIHRCDAPFDWELNSFLFSEAQIEKLQVNYHL